MERTCLLLKPDAVGRGLNFQITERFEKRGFTLIACRMRQASRELAEAHYAGLKGTAAFVRPRVHRLFDSDDEGKAKKEAKGDE